MDDECTHHNAILVDDNEPATYHCPDCGSNVGVSELEPDACEDCGGSGRGGSNTTDGSQDDDCRTCSGGGIVNL